MKYIKLFEDFADSREDRWLRSIYLTYVDSKEYNRFKRISKEEYLEALKSKLNNVKTIQYDKTRIYRIADSKDIWVDKNGRVLGEVWKEDDMESYWINIEYYDFYNKKGLN